MSVLPISEFYRRMDAVKEATDRLCELAGMPAQDLGQAQLQKQIRGGESRNLVGLGRPDGEAG